MRNPQRPRVVALSRRQRYPLLEDERLVPGCPNTGDRKNCSQEKARHVRLVHKQIATLERVLR